MVAWDESSVKRDRLGRFSRHEFGSIPTPKFLPDLVLNHLNTEALLDSDAELTPEQTDALDGYKVADFQGTNRGLRGQDDLLPEEEEQIASIDEVMASNRLSDEAWVSRAVAADAFGGKSPDELVGSEFEDPAYMSTTLSESLPGEFGEFEDLYPVVMRLRVPAGTPAYYTEGLGDTPENEHELLLGRGQRFSIQGVRQTEDGRWEVFGEVR